MYVCITRDRGHAFLSIMVTIACVCICVCVCVYTYFMLFPYYSVNKQSIRDLTLFNWRAMNVLVSDAQTVCTYCTVRKPQRRATRLKYLTATESNKQAHVR